MPIKVKSVAEISSKWARVAAQRSQDYEAGVKDPGVDWQGATVAGAGSYEAGVQDAIGRGAFGRGVQSAGNDKWRRNTATKGATRWAPGVRDAQGDFESGFAPFRDALERVTLPPRGPRGDSRNMERAVAVARALNETRRKL